jgi:hypothetical protein
MSYKNKYQQRGRLILPRLIAVIIGSAALVFGIAAMFCI